MLDAKEEIRQLVETTVERILAFVSEEIQRAKFCDIVKKTQKEINQLGTALIGKIVSIVDGEYNRQRDRHKITLRNTKTRRLMSEMGEIELTRNLYYDKQTGHYFFAVDELLGIEKRSRVEQNLKHKLIENATLTSYGKASKLSNNCVTRQTVHNIVKGIPPKRLSVRAEGLKKVPGIFIEADEDHVRLNDGRSAEVKLVYVHEGRRRVNKGRVELINAKYFATISSGTKIWETVSDYIFSQYDPDMEINVSGDGASWIKGIHDYMRGVKYTMDKFHVFKSITDAASGDRRLRRQILNSIKSGQKETTRWLYVKHGREARTMAEKKRIAGSMSYILNNFKTIDLGREYSCSAEGHVSHVLAARLSSRPMAWSREGAEKMAQLRTFYFNGGNFEEITRKEENTKEKRKYNILSEGKSHHKYVAPCAHVISYDGLTTGTSRILRQIIRK